MYALKRTPSQVHNAVNRVEREGLLAVTVASSLPGIFQPSWLLSPPFLQEMSTRSRMGGWSWQSDEVHLHEGSVGG